MIERRTVMKLQLVIAATGAPLLAPLSARAADQTVVLAVHHADCVPCAPIVKGTLEGVKMVTVSQPNDIADVTAR
jgi:hypothetical protein